MGSNKKTTKTINRRTRRILKRDSNLGRAEIIKNTRRKKGGVKYEAKPISREFKTDQKVKHWKKKLAQTYACQKCGGWVEGEICHCNCVKKASDYELIQEVNRRLKSKKLKFGIEPLPKKKTSSRM